MLMAILYLSQLHVSTALHNEVGRLWQETLIQGPACVSRALRFTG